MKAEWCPLVSYTSNLRRVRDALFDAETAWDKITKVFEGGRRAGETLAMGPFGPRRGPRFRGGPPTPFAPPSDDEAEMLDAQRRPRPPLAPATYPWQWSAGVLVGLAAASVAILMTRIRSLDRLR